MSQTPGPDRLREIEARAESGEYRCREHWGEFDADDDVRYLLAELRRWQVCENCGEPLEGPGICGKAITEYEKGLEAMLEETLTRAVSAETELRAAQAQRETLIEALRAIAFQDYTIPTGIARRALAAVQEAEAPASRRPPQEEK